MLTDKRYLDLRKERYHENLNYYCPSNICKSFLTPKDMDFLNHHYDICLSPSGEYYVKRDGIEFPGIINVQVDVDLNKSRTRLILEGYANLKDLESEWAKNNEAIPNYRIEKDPKTEETNVYMNGMLLEELQDFQIKGNADYHNIPTIKLILLAEATINWDYKEIKKYFKDEWQEIKELSENIKNECNC